MNDNIIPFGAKFKLNVNLPSIGGKSMDDYDFVIEAFVHPCRRQIIPKTEAIREDANNYIIRADTKVLGVGKVTLRVTAQIPDRDFENGFRPDICYIKTNYTIVK